MDEMNKTAAEAAAETVSQTAAGTAAEIISEELAQNSAAAEAAAATTAAETAVADATTADATVADATAADATAADATADQTAVNVPEEKVETMEDYAAELEASYRRYHTGDTITGTVIGVSETEVVLDFGYYTDGIIHLEDASDDPSFSLKENIQLGQEVTATVIRTDDGSGHMLLSMKEAAAVQAWDRLIELKNSQKNARVKISDTTKGGAIAYLEGERGFIPASRLSLEYVEEADLSSWVGKSVEVRVITAEQEGKRLVMSCREILREKEAEERSVRISNVEVGLVTEGTVDSIKPYGAFINLGNGLSGLLHISQISQKRLKSPSEVLKAGQKVTVKVIANKEGKLSLSMKELQDVMAEKAEPVEEETYELPQAEEVTTSLGSLFAKLKLQ